MIWPTKKINKKNKAATYVTHLLRNQSITYFAWPFNKESKIMNNINVIDVIIVLIEWSYGIITTGLAFFAILAIVILVFNAYNNTKRKGKKVRV